MRKKPLLTIAIPTFNRAEYLRECLESLVLGIGSDPRVEVVVSDNASTDDTPGVCGALHDTLPGLHIYRSPENIGGHRNFRRAAELAHGKFLWLLGDDDRIKPALVDGVLGELERGADMVISNVSIWSRDFSTCLKARFIPRQQDARYTTADSLLSDFGPLLGYISAVILRRECFLAVPMDEYMRYDEDGTPFLYAVYSVARAASTMVFLADPLVLDRGETPTSDLGLTARTQPEALDLVQGETRWVRVFGVGFPRTITELSTLGYGALAIRRAVGLMLRIYLIPRVYYWKRHRLDCRRFLRQAEPYCSQAGWPWRLTQLLSVCPLPVLETVRSLRK